MEMVNCIESHIHLLTANKVITQFFDVVNVFQNHYFKMYILYIT